MMQSHHILHAFIFRKKEQMRLVYDIETDGLDATKIWVLVAHNLDSGTMYCYSDYDDSLPSVSDGVQLLANADLLVGHNIIGFDNRVIDRLYGTDLNSKKLHDTWIMSQVLKYKRHHKHGLAGWGEALGNSKIDYNDWSQYSKEMLRYCKQDVKVNVDIYNALIAEFKAVAERRPLIAEGLRIEHDVAVFNALVREQGWNFDVEKAIHNQARMEDRMAEIEAVIHPQLGERKIFIDKQPKTPKFKKDGTYTAASHRIISEYLGRELGPTDTPLAAGTEFQRYRMEPITLGSVDLVKDWLLDMGWKPDEYQRKKVGFEWVTTGPKLTTTSLTAMGEIGVMIDEYYTLRNRRSVIAGWLDQVKDGRLHGNMWTIGTPTFRARHEVIVNLPAVTASWGQELRELFLADDGDVVVGADSSGNQLRGLCHYVGNEDFTREVIHGDQHQRNAEALGCSRPVAKSYLYAYLFGAGDAKLGQVLTGTANPSKGKKSREDFAKGIKGLQELRDKLGKAWRQTSYQGGDGWFPGLDGRPVYCGSEHQALNYLLQSAEGITCKAAVSWAMKKIKEEGLRAKPRIFYHDEMAWTSHPDDAERVGQILKDSFAEGPKLFNVNCMDGGDPVIGKSYADVH